LLRQEFPDVTISKIRFLESQGLVNPERTPSGYRKFYEHDVERLRWVLRQQREHFLPLKVIKDRLDDGTNGSVQTVPDPEPGQDSDSPDTVQRPVAESVLVGQSVANRRVAGAPAPVPEEVPSLPSTPSVTAGPTRTAGRAASGPRDTRELTRRGSGRQTPAGTPDRPAEPPSQLLATGVAPHPPTLGQEGTPDTPDAAPEPEPATSDSQPAVPTPEAPPVSERPSSRVRPPSSGATRSAGAGSSVESHITVEELATASGLDLDVLAELREYGLLSAIIVGGTEYFDDEALAVATLAAGFARFGVEPRHLRLYKNAADREAGFVEQIVLPLVRQRNPEARTRAVATREELIGLGQGLRSALLRNALRELFGS
jgi:DNA-binding transcriptional MerR regulator